MNRLKNVLLSAAVGIFISIAFLLFKNIYVYQNLKTAEFGMPMLIKQGNIDNLFLGSSTFRQGLDIYQIEEQLGADSYILAYDGNQPVMEYLELKYLYENGAKIRRLFVDLYPYSMAAEFKISDEKIFMETDLGFKLALADILASEGDYKDIYEMFIKANNEIVLTWKTVFPYIEQRFYKGGNIAASSAALKEQLDKMEVPVINGSNSQQLEYLSLLLDLAEKNQTEIVFLETPKYRLMEYADSYRGILKEIEKQINSEGVRCLLVTDFTADEGRGDEICFDLGLSDYYSDLVHLSEAGRKEFTGRLLDVISQR